MIFRFDKTSWHKIWADIVPEDAPNDLAYRLKSGPTYTILGAFDPEKGREVIRLRPPNIVFEKPKLHNLNEYDKSVFEIDEFRLILRYMDEFRAADKQPFDQYIFSDLYNGLKAFFDGDTSRYDAILLEYFL